MPVLKFTKNWNRKLDADHYTTFRLDATNWRKNELYDVELAKKHHHRAVCIDKKILKLEQVNDWIATLDAGVNRAEFITLITALYSNTVDVSKADFCLLLMKKLR